MIQGSINQLLGQVAIFGRLDPNFESRQQAMQSKKQLKVLNKQLEATNQGKPAPEEGTTRYNITKDIEKDIATQQRKLFEAKPSSKTYREYSLSRSSAFDEPIAQLGGEDPMYAYNQLAEEKMLAEQERVRKSREAMNMQLLANSPNRYGVRRTNIDYGNK